MKKVFLLILNCFIGFYLSAQSLELYTNENAKIENGQVINVSVTKYNETIKTRMQCKNISTSSVPVLVKKTILSQASFSEIYFCWFDCYSSTISLSPDAIDISSGNIISDFEADYFLEKGTETSEVQYTFFNANNINDSICFILKYSVPAHIEEPSNFVWTIYPNPILETLSISCNANMENVNVYIYDVNGKIMFQQMLSSNCLNLNTFQWTNGIYFIELRKNNKIITTKRVVKQ